MINPLKHVSILPDGHRRYARANGISFAESYKSGWSNILNIAKYLLLEEDLDEVTYHGLYSYNLDRTGPDLEVYLNVSILEIKNLAEALHHHGIDIYFSGELSVLYDKRPEYREVIEQLPKKQGSKKRFNLLFAYSSEKEVVRAIQQLTEEGVPFKDISYEAIMQKCFSPNPVSLIFTSGQKEFPEQKQSFPYLASVTPHLTNARICTSEKSFPAVDIDHIKTGISEYKKMYSVILEKIAMGK